MQMQKGIFLQRKKIPWFMSN